LPCIGFVAIKINWQFAIRSISMISWLGTAILFIVRHFDYHGSDDRQGHITLPG